MSCRGVSSKQTTGLRASGGSACSARTSPIRAANSPSTFGMHHIFFCHGLMSISPSRRRIVSDEIVSCTVRRTISSASNCRVQCALPDGGGNEQATAQSFASSSTSSFRGAPPPRQLAEGTRSRPSSTNCCLVRYTVDVPTATLLAIASSVEPWSAAGGSEHARSPPNRDLAALDHGFEVQALIWRQSDPISNILMLAPSRSL